MTWLVWLRQAPKRPNSRHMLEHIERLRYIQALDLPDRVGRNIHRDRLVKLAREGDYMTPQNLEKFESTRRHATLVAMIVEALATLTDEVIDLHDRIMMTVFSKAKNKHQEEFQSQGKAINDKVRLYSKVGHALLEAKHSHTDPFAAIESVIPWDMFTKSIADADRIVQPASFDHLHLIDGHFRMLRRYTPIFLTVLKLHAAPSAQKVLDAVQVVRDMNREGARAVPAHAPTSFIKPRWAPLIMVDGTSRID